MQIPDRRGPVVWADAADELGSEWVQIPDRRGPVVWADAADELGSEWVRIPDRRGPVVWADAADELGSEMVQIPDRRGPVVGADAADEAEQILASLVEEETRQLSGEDVAQFWWDGVRMVPSRSIHDGQSNERTRSRC